MHSLLNRIAFFMLASLITAAAWAAAPVRVVQVQPPAWLDRGGVAIPLLPGSELQPGDEVATGRDGRAYLRLAEGSMVKLGQHARYQLEGMARDQAGVFGGSMNVLLGAFRLTTGALEKLRGKRDLTIRVGTATIGIRGTDVWGRASAEGELVALIEGRIALRRDGVDYELKPMSYLDAPYANPPQVKLLDLPTLKRLARETEIEDGDGALSRGERNKSTGFIARFDTQDAVLDAYDRVRQAGYPVRIVPQAAREGWNYELHVAGGARAKELRAIAQRAKRDLSASR